MGINCKAWEKVHDFQGKVTERTVGYKDASFNRNHKNIKTLAGKIQKNLKILLEVCFNSIVMF